VARVTGNGAGRGGARRGYSWPQATAQNQIALVHGSYSERKVGPRAAEIEQWLLGEDGPPHLRHAVYAPLVRQYSRMYAQCELAGEWAGEQDFIAALTERWSEEEEAEHEGGRARKRTTGQRTMSAWDAYDRSLARLITLARELLLSPAAMARAKVETEQGPDVMTLMAERIRELDREAASGC
jgi:hypothetical protein